MKISRVSPVALAAILLFVLPSISAREKRIKRSDLPPAIENLLLKIVGERPFAVFRKKESTDEHSMRLN